ncbi:hypothetical protein ACOMDM_03560 [Serratia plymuthica]|uniref:hypothetical protein n=1 Tax=Serratia plymuthica TaxID=82996 RepID=UPI00390CCCF5
MLYAIKPSPARASLLVLLLAIAAPAISAPANEAPCVATSMTLPPGALYPNGIARASDGTLYVGLITSGRVLRKRPNQDWQTFFPGTDTVFASNALRLDERRGLRLGHRITHSSPPAARA